MSSFTIEDTLPESIIIPRQPPATGGGGVANIDHSSATFYRTSANSNITIDVPLGTVDANNIYTSEDAYLPPDAYNDIKSTDAISFTGADATILADQTAIYDINIQFKLIGDDGYNFVNQRSIYTTLVNGSNIEYEPSMAHIIQPDTGYHETITIKGSIDHVQGDVVKLRMTLAQDNKLNGQSGSNVVIFNLSWNITSLL
jgi:hypothetical protein